MINKLRTIFFLFFDFIFRKFDRTQILRTQNIKLIPAIQRRIGGKKSYAEWAHVIGIFQTLIFDALDGNAEANMVDIGCGTGILGIAAKPYIKNYTGLDISERDVNFCRNHYKGYDFVHFDLANPAYEKRQSTNKTPWPLESDSFDLLTALSVWTHLNEDDSRYYFKEVSRVLKTNGKAIITFFVLDEMYQNSLQKRENKNGRYHNTNQLDWIFDESSYGSSNWFHPKWVRVPEDAIGLTSEGLDILLEDSKLELERHYHGNWKEIPGLYFQDILILKKK